MTEAAPKAAAAIFQEWVRRDGPHSAMIEIADRCNETCVHCYQVQGLKGELSTAELRDVIDQLAEIGVLFLTLSGGEPTLRQDFLEIVAHARARGFAVSIYTNAILIDRAMAAELGRLGVAEAQISLYSHRAEVHDAITRLPGSFDRTVRGIRLLVAERITVRVKTPLMSVNADEVPEYEAFVEGLGAHFGFGTQLMAREDGTPFPAALRPTPEQLHKFFRWRSAQSGFETPRREVDAAPCGACGAAGGKLHVEPNGALHPCTQLDHSLGHAVRDGVRKTWLESEEPRSVRQLTWADLHGCRECDLRDHCRRCHATALNETGDALGPYPSGCTHALVAYGAEHGGPPDVIGQGNGPYRQVGPGRLRTIPDVVEDRDRELRGRHPWLAPGQPAETPDVRRIRRSRAGAASLTPERSDRFPDSGKLDGLESTNRWRGT